jgi:hypothetical protein
MSVTHSWSRPVRVNARSTGSAAVRGVLLLTGLWGRSGHRLRIWAAGFGTAI